MRSIPNVGAGWLNGAASASKQRKSCREIAGDTPRARGLATALPKILPGGLGKRRAGVVFPKIKGLTEIRESPIFGQHRAGASLFD